MMDHTFGNVDYSFSHLNELRSIDCIDNNTLIYGAHILHDGMNLEISKVVIQMNESKTNINWYIPTNRKLL